MVELDSKSIQSRVIASSVQTCARLLDNVGCASVEHNHVNFLHCSSSAEYDDKFLMRIIIRRFVTEKICFN